MPPVRPKRLAGAASISSVYRLFASKVSILTAVLDTSLVGDDEPVAMPRSVVKNAFAESTPALMLDAFATLCREVHERSGALHQVLRTAASVDGEAAALLAEANRQRSDGQSRIARALLDRHALADDLSERDAVDIIYALMSPDVHRLLTRERGWSPDRYEAWLGATLHALLRRRDPHRRAPTRRKKP